MEDGLRAGLFTIDKLNAIPLIKNLINKEIKNKKKYRREIIVNQIVRKLINEMVLDVIKNSQKNLKRIKPHSLNDIYKQKSNIVKFSPKMKEFDKQIKNFLKKNMYDHKNVIVNTNKGKVIIKDLFKFLVKNPFKHIDKKLFKNMSKERVVADFIAGMTDRYAINLHKNIK